MLNSNEKIEWKEDDTKTEVDLFNEYKNYNISDNLEDNKTYIKEIFNKGTDLIIREFTINTENDKSMLIYMDNMVNLEVMESVIIKKLCDHNENVTAETFKYMFGISDKKIYKILDKVIKAILNGKIILIVDKISEAFEIDIKNLPSRGIEQPTNEKVLSGPRESFSESIAINVALIRKRIKNTNLKIQDFIIGKETNTDVKVMYLSNIANPKVVNEVIERLKKIKIDSVLDSNYIKECIEDERLSNFPTLFTTEKPDVAAAKILEGRIAILVDGTPMVITAPALFVEFIYNNEDFYLKFMDAILNRIVRYMSLFIAIFLPGLYVAVTSFHQELIPTALLVTVIKAREGVPYPAVIECFIMLFIYEILRESGVRMPGTIGQAMSVVGPLVLGQAAVEAGLVSTPMVIVVSVTALSSFAISNIDMNMALIYLRVIFLILGGAFGLLGVTCGIIILIIKLISIRSFGVPYLLPLAPMTKDRIPYVVIRRPIWDKGRSFFKSIIKNRMVKKVISKFKNRKK